MKKELIFAATLLAAMALGPIHRATALDILSSPGDRIVDPGAKLELLFTREEKPNFTSGLTEGPAAAPDGRIYFTDYPVFEPVESRILRFDPRTGKTDIFVSGPHRANGLKFDASGYLLACEGADGGGRCISRWNVETRQRMVLANQYQGKKLNSPNDLVVDKLGRIYFSDPRYVGAESRDLKYHAVYRVDRAGRVVEITHNIQKANGVALSPDNRTLYVGEHNNGTDKIRKDMPAPKKGAMKVYAFPLNEKGLVAGPRRQLYDFGKEDGCDGMTVDTEGNLYLAARAENRHGVLILNPKTAKEIGFIPTDAIPSNVTFGAGPEISTLYITAGKSLYRIRLKTRGFHPWMK